MPKKRKADHRPEEHTTSSKATDSKQTGKLTTFLVALGVIALILIIPGTGIYNFYVAPFRINVIIVDDTPIRMDYLLKRLRLTNADPWDMITTLINEQLIKTQAPKYGIEVNTDDIDQILRSIARGESANITESEFKEWYRQQLNESDLSDSEYKDLVTINLLLTPRLHEILAERVPTVAEQIHLNVLDTETFDDAKNAKTRFEAGEDFADLAQGLSIDEESAKNDGDIGWYPRGIMDNNIESVIFNLSIGEISEPIPSENGFSLIMVSEKSNAREVEEEHLQTLRDLALNDWLLEEMRSHEIKYNGLTNGFDSETHAWINWQLSKE